MAEGLGRVLIVSATEQGTLFLNGLLQEFMTESSVISVKSGAEARRVLSGNEFDFIFINMPLTDETGVELAKSASQGAGFVIVFVKSGLAEQIADKLSEDGLFVIQKPVVRPQLINGLRVMLTAKDKMRKLQNENDKIRKKLEDQMIISRAKCVLIYHLQIDEAEAHRKIEMRAMNERRPKREIAIEILHEFDDE